MKTRNLKIARTIVVSVAIFATACFCLPNRSPTPRGVDVSDVFMKHAKKNEWFLVGKGGFYALDKHADCYRIPKADDEPPFELLDSHHFGSFDISRDGKMIVADSTPLGSERTGHSYLTIFDPSLNVVFIDKEDRADSAYRLAPNKKQIAFATHNQLRVFDIKTRKITDLTDDQNLWRGSKNKAPSGPPSWGPSSDKLVYEATKEKVTIIDLATKEKTVIGDGENPTWSPDGKTITWVAEGDVRVEHVAMAYDVKSKTTRELFRQKKSRIDDLIWSPDNRFLVWRHGLHNSIYGDVRFYDFTTEKVASTGEYFASIRFSMIAKVPKELRAMFKLPHNHETENPNRSPRFR